MSYVLDPPIAPMLAKLARALPTAGDWWFEPKWDGFRLLAFRDGDDIYLQSRNRKPVLRYFPELGPALRDALPERCVVDGEIVMPVDGRLDFNTLQMRLHPAASRVEKLAAETPSQVILFDLLALEQDHQQLPFVERRRLLETHVRPSESVHLTPGTPSADVAAEWFRRFEGAGLDGVIAKDPASIYTPGKRTMKKIKHERTLDCVVAGFRWYRNAPGVEVGSLMLAVYADDGSLESLGVCSAFSAKRRVELLESLEPLRAGALEQHPWAEWSTTEGARPGMASRWNAGRDLSWEPVRLELVAEVSCTQLDGGRLRHPAKLLHLRHDKDPRECTAEQLQVAPAPELGELLGA